MDDTDRPDGAGFEYKVTTLAPTSAVIDRKSRRVKWGDVSGSRGFQKLLKDMKAQSGLSTRALAERMGIQRESLNHYFWAKRGEGGTSKLNWFLRYAEACGCTIWCTFPSMKSQVELKARYSRPVGNPNWRRKEGE